MLGQLPSGYSKAVHGPYDPAVFYGKPDIPLSQVMQSLSHPPQILFIVILNYNCNLSHIDQFLSQNDRLIVLSPWL